MFLFDTVFTPPFVSLIYAHATFLRTPPPCRMRQRALDEAVAPYASCMRCRDIECAARCAPPAAGATMLWYFRAAAAARVIQMFFRAWCLPLHAHARMPADMSPLCSVAPWWALIAINDIFRHACRRCHLWCAPGDAAMPRRRYASIWSWLRCYSAARRADAQLLRALFMRFRHERCRHAALYAALRHAVVLCCRLLSACLRDVFILMRAFDAIDAAFDDAPAATPCLLLSMMARQHATHWVPHFAAPHIFFRCCRHFSPPPAFAIFTFYWLLPMILFISSLYFDIFSALRWFFIFAAAALFSCYMLIIFLWVILAALFSRCQSLLTCRAARHAMLFSLSASFFRHFFLMALMLRIDIFFCWWRFFAPPYAIDAALSFLLDWLRHSAMIFWCHAALPISLIFFMRCFSCFLPIGAALMLWYFHYFRCRWCHFAFRVFYALIWCWCCCAFSLLCQRVDRLLMLIFCWCRFDAFDAGAILIWHAIFRHWCFLLYAPPCCSVYAHALLPLFATLDAYYCCHALIFYWYADRWYADECHAVTRMRMRDAMPPPTFCRYYGDDGFLRCVISPAYFADWFRRCRHDFRWFLLRYFYASIMLTPSRCLLPSRRRLMAFRLMAAFRHVTPARRFRFYADATVRATRRCGAYAYGAAMFMMVWWYSIFLTL